MLSYCLKYREKTDNKNPKIVMPKNRIIIVLWNCAVYGSKKFRFIKEQEANRILRSLGLKTSWSKIPIVCPILV